MTPLILFIIMSLAHHRITRFFTADVWPPVAKLRRTLIHLTGESSPWSELWTCPWCLGLWLAIPLVLAIDLLTPYPIHLPVLQILAISSVTGLLSGHEESS